MTTSIKKEIWEQSKEWIDAIGDVVNEMASKLGVASEHVYTVYTKQMFFQGIMEIVSSLLFVGFLFVILKYGLGKLKHYIENESEDDNDDARETFVIVSVIATFIFIVITGFQLHDIKVGAMMAFNPEYYTMKDLLESVKDLISEPTNNGQ